MSSTADLEELTSAKVRSARPTLGWGGYRDAGVNLHHSEDILEDEPECLGALLARDNTLLAIECARNPGVELEFARFNLAPIVEHLLPRGGDVPLHVYALMLRRELGVDLT